MFYFIDLISALIDFDHLGLETLRLTTLERELSDLAQDISLKQLENLGVQTTHTLKSVVHNIVKRGTNSPGYYALPIPPLPTDMSEESTRLFTKPNKRLIRLANRLALQKRQGDLYSGILTPEVLPPATNQNFKLNSYQTEDPFLLTIGGKQNYPNSIQDVLSHVAPEDPNPYIEVYTTPKPPKPPKKKKIIYKVVTKKPPKKENGTTKKIVYKLATTTPKPPDPYPGVNTPTTKHTTKKPEVIYHTRKPYVDDTNNDHTQPPKTVVHKDNPKDTPKHPDTPPKKENYMAVIPYQDIAKLFEMLNKHTKPANNDGGYMKKMKKHKTTPKPLPHPTTKRTEVLQPKVIKRTPLGRKKKKKKTVHVSFTKGASINYASR